MASLLLSAKTSYATRKGTSAGARPYKDIYGTSYKKPENLFRDKDKTVCAICIKNVIARKAAKTSAGGECHGIYV